MRRLRLFPVFVLTCALHAVAYQNAPANAVGRLEAGPSPETITVWETRLQTDPEDLVLRGTLLSYYMSHGPGGKYLAQALWVVQHHPESRYAGLTSSAGTVDGKLTEPDYALLKSAWEQAMIDQADNGKMLYNAGLFFARQDPVRAVHVLEQARQLDSENGAILKTEATVYAKAFLGSQSSPMKPADAQALQGELAGASDSALLAEVGSYLIGFARGPQTALKPKGMELINRAISLDPANEQWRHAAERAAFTPPPPPPVGASGTPSGPVRVGAHVAEANLIRKVAPVYPAAAVPIRISGTVDFTAVISEQGHIQNLQLVRGHPLLVNAAKDAVLQYQYKPTLLNGRPVPVMTSIIVPFQAPAQ